MVTFFLFGPFKTQAFAVTNTYTGSSGAWETNGNWDQGHAPTSGEDVVIDKSVTVTINGGTTIHSLVLGDATPSFTPTLTFGYDANSAALTITGGNLTENTGSTINHTAGTSAGGGTIVGRIYINITSGSATITGNITVDGKGYPGATSNTIGSGTGGGQHGGAFGNGSGGGYGGTGSFGFSLNPGGTTYGSLTAPVDLGSGGGGADNGSHGGNGGGAVQITASGTITVSGTISANGTNDSNNDAGGGSGGSIYLTAATLAGGGTVRANGGNGGGGAGSGGGGGRIALIFTSSYTFSGTITVNLGTGGSANSFNLSYGTAFIEDTTNEDITVPVQNGKWQGSDRASWAFRDITINNGVYFTSSSGSLLTISSSRTTTFASASYTVYMGGSNTTNSNGAGVYLTLTGNVTIPSTVTLSGDSLGYAAGAANSSGSGPGAGGHGGCFNHGRGAGYGGAGSDGCGENSGGITYGSSNAPTDLGSSGGGGSGALGGAGGGAIRITTDGTLTISGTISAAGGGAGGTDGGGGAGGSIYLTAGTFTGAGTLQANGGAGSSAGGGGGGGRIAIYYNVNSWSGNSLTPAVAAVLGATGSGGGNGTVTLTYNGTAPAIPNLVTYWKLDDGQGTSSSDGTTQGWNLGLAGTPTWQTEDQCVAGKCLYFNGSSQYASSGAAVNLSNTKQVTVEFWLKWMSFSNDGKQAVELGSNYTGNTDAFYISPNGSSGSNRFEFGLKGDVGTTNSYFAQPSAKVWHHYVFIFDKTTGSNTLAAYVDGISQTLTSLNSSANTNTFGSRNMYLMSRGGASNFGNGYLDEVKVFNYDRTATQILGDLAARSVSAGASSTYSRIFQNNIPTGLSNGLAGYWNFNSTSNSATTATDSQGSNNGTYTTGATTVGGKFGYGGFFDGTNDYVLKTSPTGLPTGTSARTIVTWFKLTSASIRAMALGGWGDNVTGERMNVWINTTCGGELGIEDAGGARTFTWTPDTNWHQFAAVLPSGATNLNQMLLYLDGAPQTGYCTSTSQTINTTSGQLVLGDLPGAPVAGYSYPGRLDDWQIYNTDLSSGNISTLYSSAPTTLSGLVGRWKFDETTDVYSDLSGNSNTTGNNDSGPVAAGKFGYGAALNGVSDFVDAGNGSTLQITSNLSLSALINLTNHTSTHDILAKDGTSGSYGYRLYVDTNGKLNMEVSSNGTATTTVTGSTTLSSSAWYQVAGVYIPGVSLTVYVNGVPDGVNTASIPSSINNPSVDLNIGSENGSATSTGTANYFTGTIDEPRAYNISLHGEDITGLSNFAAGPVGYWNFDEGTGTTAYDSSGNANNGTLTSSPTYTTGKFGDALTFGASTNYVTIADADTLDTVTPTFSAWIKTSKTTGEVVYSHYKNGSPFDGFGIGVAGASCIGGTTGALSFWSSGQGAWVQTTTTVNDGNWHYISTTYDGTTLKMYIDGTQAYSAAETAPGITTNSALIGIDGGFTSACDFNGQIDDVKVYNYPRNPAQVVSDMNAGHPAPGSPIGSAIGYWKFDEGVDNTCSGGTNDACNSGSGGNTYDMANSGTVRTLSGKSGRAITVDTNTDTLSVTDPSFVDSATAMTFNLWLNPATLATSKDILGKWTSGNTSNNFRIMTDSSSSSDLKICIANATNDACTNYYTTSALGLSTSTWQYISIVYDGTEVAANRIRVYKNGRIATGSVTGTIPTSMTTGTTPNLILGDTIAGSTALLSSYDELKIYTSALSADQVKTDANLGHIQVLGALSSGSSNSDQPNAASQEYCVPGGTDASCAAPIAEYKLDENKGTTAYDISGNGNNGTWDGSGSPRYKPGKFNSSGSFDGTTDSIYATNTSNLQFGSGDFTLSAWIKSSTSTGNTEYVMINYGSGGTPPYYAIWLDSSSHVAIFGFRDGSSHSVTATGTTAVNDGKWHHLTGIRSGTTGYIYVDGTLQASNTNGSVGSVSPGCSYIRIGGASTVGSAGDFCTRTSATEAWFPGQIDQIRIYNYARSAPQVAWEFNRGGPIGWWKLDENTGTTAYDASLNGNDNANGNNGSFGDSPTYVSGKLNYGLSFDGSDDYVQSASNITLSGSTSKTMSAWVNFASGDLQLNHEVVAAGWGWNDPNSTDPSAGGAFTLAAYGAAGAGHWAMWGVGGGADDVSSTSTLSSGTWYHLVATYDGTTVRLYNNGMPDGTSTVTLATNNSKLYFGHKMGTAGDRYWFGGKLDDVRIYNYALDATQVKDLYNAEGGAVRYGPASGTP